MIRRGLSALCLLMASTAVLAEPRRPNILLVVADDLGVNDLSFHPARGRQAGAPPVSTPNIDRIAREGVAFTRAYAASATCAPSRAALLSGRYAQRAGFEFNPGAAAAAQLVGAIDWHGIPANVFPERAKALPPPGEIGFDSSVPLLPALLRDAGYRTAAFGKWHLGDAPRFRPENRGFDRFVGFYGAASMFADPADPAIVNAPLRLDKPFWKFIPYEAVRNGVSIATRQYQTDLWADEAIRFIDEGDGRQPFFAYLAFNAPHNPLQAPRAIYDELAHVGSHEARVYFAMVVAMDRALGRVIARLEQRGELDNTLILFTSDNGGADALTELWTHNLPFRGQKGSFWFGGVGVPLFARLPGTFEGGRQVNATVSLLDIAPTLVGLSGGRAAAAYPLDGRSLLAPARARRLFFRADHVRGVVDGRWKLKQSDRPERTWLYDLARDPFERVNLASRRPRDVARLRALIAAHFAGMEAPRFPAMFEVPTPADQWPPGTSGDERRALDFVFYPG